MRAAIYGAGAMGTVLGAFITAGGKDIDLITRNREHVRALSEGGARITGKVDMNVKVNALTPDGMTGRYDIIFLMTKQRQNGEIVRGLLDFLAEDGVICTLQNGLPEPSVAAVAGRERCLGCAVSWGASKSGYGGARLTSEREKMTFALGSIYGENGKIDAVKEYLGCAGRVTVEKNFVGARWAKLAINSAFSPLSAVTGLTFGEIARDKYGKRVALGLLNEAFSVAEACGVRIEKIQGHDIVGIYRCKGGLKRAVATALLPFAMKGHRDLVSGMYYDLKDGGKCDMEFVNGVVSRMGKKFGVETPLNDGILALAHAIERNERALSSDNIEMFVKNFKR